jgi:hypothetical protein
VKRDDAKTYQTDEIYSVGELIYHPKLEDVGLVTDKGSLPAVDCSGSITVSFIEVGQKTLIEGCNVG